MINTLLISYVHCKPKFRLFDRRFRQGTPYCAPNLKLQRRIFDVVADQNPLIITQFISTFISRRTKHH